MRKPCPGLLLASIHRLRIVNAADLPPRRLAILHARGPLALQLALGLAALASCVRRTVPRADWICTLALAELLAAFELAFRLPTNCVALRAVSVSTLRRTDHRTLRVGAHLLTFRQDRLATSCHAHRRSAAGCTLRIAATSALATVPRAFRVALLCRRSVRRSVWRLVQLHGILFEELCALGPAVEPQPTASNSAAAFH